MFIINNVNMVFKIIKEGVYIMIKVCEIVKEKKLVIDCKNGDFVQFGKHIHVICDDGTNKNEKNTMDLKTGLFYLIPKYYYVKVVKYKEV